MLVMVVAMMNELVQQVLMRTALRYMPGEPTSTVVLAPKKISRSYNTHLGRPPETCPTELTAAELDRFRHAREVKAGLWRPNSVLTDIRVHEGLVPTLGGPEG